MEEFQEYRGLLKKISSFCASKERTEKEVIEKLTSWECSGENLDCIVSVLKNEKFLDEERFARNYVSSKF
jgi:regulatory protein